MQVASMHFKERAHVKLQDDRLQGNLKKLQTKFVAKRRASLVELNDFEATREAGKAIRNRALENLDVWLEIFEQNATARGATVLFAETPADINSLVLEIAAKHRVARPADWKQGQDVIIAGSVTNDDAKKIWPEGWKEPKPYIRIVPQPRG